MKKLGLVLLSCLVMAAAALPVQARDKDSEYITHVVFIWLKKPGNLQMQKEFVTASRTLNDLPGIVNRHVGIVEKSDRKIVDDSFDVAVTVTLKSKQALKAYLNHPRHKKLLEEVLKPMVGKIVAYDFVGK